MVDCYTCNFTVACPRRIKKMKALKMSRSVKGLYEKVQSCLSAHRLQKVFKYLPHSSCSGLIPQIQKTFSCMLSKKEADSLTHKPNSTEFWGLPRFHFHLEMDLIQYVILALRSEPLTSAPEQNIKSYSVPADATRPSWPKSADQTAVT